MNSASSDKDTISYADAHLVLHKAVKVKGESYLSILAVSLIKVRGVSEIHAQNKLNLS